MPSIIRIHDIKWQEFKGVKWLVTLLDPHHFCLDTAVPPCEADGMLYHSCQKTVTLTHD